MKKKSILYESTPKSKNPYADRGLTVKAPHAPKETVKGSAIRGRGDMRAKG